MSAIYENALDSLRIGYAFFRQESGYSSRKHAILTIFHALELFLKERLFRINPILIYRNIDAPITDDSLTVGVNEMLVRFKNLNMEIRKEEAESIKKLQRVRNRIEHHRYDHKPEEDEAILAETLKVILYFVEFELEERLGDVLGAELMSEMQHRVIDYNEHDAVAHYRMEEWWKKQWPEWGGPEESDSPEEFLGTLDCPHCRQSYLVLDHVPKGFCFHCNTTVDALICDECGRTHLREDGCCSTYKIKTVRYGEVASRSEFDRLVAGLGLKEAREGSSPDGEDAPP